MIHKVGERISSYRKDRNMSQEELATLLNVSRQTISKWETGDTLPDVYNAVAIAKMFHVSLDVLILGTHGKLGGPSYLTDVKAKRQKTNLWAIVVGATGSTILIVALTLLRAYEVSQNNTGIVTAVVMAVLMICWGYAIWGFIKVSRLNTEIKYLEQIEFTNLLTDAKTKN